MASAQTDGSAAGWAPTLAVSTHCYHDYRLKEAPGGKGVWDFPALGEGKTDFARILSALHDSGHT